MGSEEITKRGMEAIKCYERRSREIAGLIKEAARRIEESFNEQETLMQELRARLAKSQGLRKKDFDSIMEGVLKKRGETVRELKASMEDLWGVEGDVTGLLTRSLASNDLDLLGRIKKEVLPEQRKKERKVANLLMKLDLEQREFGGLLETLMERSSLRVRDFKALVSSVSKIFGKESELEGILTRFDALRQEVRVRWGSLDSVYQETFPITGEGNV